MLLALNLFIVVARAPQGAGHAPGFAAALFVGGLVFLLYTLMLRDHRKRVEARASDAMPPGSMVRLDAAGLTVGGFLELDLVFAEGR